MSLWSKIAALFFEEVETCAHVWLLDRVTYAPPDQDFSLHNYWIERGEPRERALHGCTTILELCKVCGKRRETVALGKTISEAHARELFSTYSN